MIEHIIAQDKDAVIYCEGCIHKVYDYTHKIYLQVEDDVLIKNLKQRRETLMLKRKNLQQFTPEELQYKLDKFLHHDVEAKNKHFDILQHNTDKQREQNLNYLINLAYE